MGYVGDACVYSRRDREGDNMDLDEFRKLAREAKERANRVIHSDAGRWVGHHIDDVPTLADAILALTTEVEREQQAAAEMYDAFVAEVRGLTSEVERLRAELLRAHTFVSRVSDYSNDGWLAREALTFFDPSTPPEPQ